MKSKTTAVAVLAAALIVGAFAHQIASREAAALGLSLLEISLLGAAAGAFATRTIPA
jgi:hypothetical protein